MIRSLVLCLVIALGGCDLLQGPDLVTDCLDGDADCDGVLDSDDCAPDDPDVSPNETEACNGVDDDCDSEIDEGFDADGDGVTTCAGDCDDTDPTAYEGAEEACGDGIDNDCDGIIDNGPDTDDDGDGVCTPADCDDTEAGTYPGATELCNGVDEDCDTEIDEGFDADGDGFFDGAVADCVAAYEQVDCDDADANEFPGATEVCDGEDNDCDGTPDSPITEIDDDGDGVSVCTGEDCDDTDPTVLPGGFETANGVDDDCDGTPDDAFEGTGSASLLDTTFDGPLTLANIGTQVSNPGDFNGDGLTDFMATGPQYASGKGRAFLWLGSAFDVSNQPGAPTANINLTGPVAGESLGTGAAFADLDGDGYDEIILGSPEAQSATTPNGFVRIFWGSAAFVAGIWDADDADILIVGGHGVERCGQSVANAGDMNGDGKDELAIGCPWYTDTSGIVGRTAIFLGRDRASWQASYTSDDADATILGDGTDENTGTWVAGVGDLNDDGKDDLAIGSTEWGGSQGRVGIKLGGGASSFDVGDRFADLDRLYDGELFDNIGTWFGGGDLNGDGIGDLFVGANGFDGGRGRTMVLYGSDPLPASGDLLALADAVFTAENALDAGGTWATTADLDGDGNQDFFVSSPAWEGPAGGGQGRVSVFLGPVTASVLSPSMADVTLIGENNGDSLGVALIAAPDVNGDGAEDVIVSAPANDGAAAAGGRLYLWAGLP